MSADITAGRHGGNPESAEASASIDPDKARLRRLVVAYVRTCGEAGATCDEVEEALGLAHQTASARITEAKALGELRRTDDRRPTRSGRNAAVLVAIEEEYAHV